MQENIRVAINILTLADTLVVIMILAVEVGSANIQQQKHK